MVFGHHHHHKQEEEAYNTMYGDTDLSQHDGSVVHEMLAGAAAFAAMRSYEQERAAEGINDHAFAREMLAAISAAEVDKLAETKGLDMVDRERAKMHAQQKANEMYDSYYVQEQPAAAF